MRVCGCESVCVRECEVCAGVRVCGCEGETLFSCGETMGEVMVRIGTGLPAMV